MTQTGKTQEQIFTPTMIEILTPNVIANRSKRKRDVQKGRETVSVPFTFHVKSVFKYSRFLKKENVCDVEMHEKKRRKVMPIQSKPE
jgi:hypothetical protein